MKKLVQIIVLAFALLFTVHSSQFTVSAQDFNSDKAYTDYVFTRSNYDIAYTNYEKARDIYLKNKTLTLKEEARVATLEMLKTRDDLYRVYLTALRTKVTENKGLTSDEKGNLYTKLDSEVLYYQGHRLTYTGNETLADVFKVNTAVEDHYKKITFPFIYETLFMISYGQEVNIKQEHQNIFENLINYLNQKVAEGKLIIDPFNRWFLDINGTLDILQKNELAAKAGVQKLYSESSTQNRPYNNSIGILTQSITSLNKLNNFVTELLTAIESQI